MLEEVLERHHGIGAPAASIPTWRSCSAQHQGSARASAVVVRPAGAEPSRMAATIRGDTKASGASRRTRPFDHVRVERRTRTIG
jgi:hypothetical protein